MKGLTASMPLASSADSRSQISEFLYPLARHRRTRLDFSLLAIFATRLERAHGLARAAW